MTSYISLVRTIFVIGITLTTLSTSLYSHECSPPPFEKIYVGPRDILSTPYGIFHVTPDGRQERIRALRSDWCGTYILKFKHECPICGRCYDGDTVEEGYDCPIYKTEIIPHLWCK